MSLLPSENYNTSKPLKASLGETSPLCCNMLGCIKTRIIVVKTQQNFILHYVLTVH
jgi:hypothetical protein